WPLLSCVLDGPPGMLYRLYLEETEAFLESRVALPGHTQTRTLLAQHCRGLGVTFGLVICGTVSYYVVLVYMPTFAKSQLGMPLTDAFVAQAIGLTCLTAVI